MFGIPCHLISFFQMLVKFRQKTPTLLLEAVFDNLMYGMAELQKLKSMLPQSGARTCAQTGAEAQSAAPDITLCAQFEDDADDIFSTERTGTDG